MIVICSALAIVLLLLQGPALDQLRCICCSSWPPLVKSGKSATAVTEFILYTIVRHFTASQQKRTASIK